jgi:hypothetical protein
LGEKMAKLIFCHYIIIRIENSKIKLKMIYYFSNLFMSSTTFSFDESKFIYKFVCDYYTETDFDLESSFGEYFNNFIDSNSYEYNMYIFHHLLSKFKVSKDKITMTIRNYLYEKLYEIIKDAMKQ